MPAYKNKDSGSWYVVTQYTDWTGERKQKCKRGFATRREALEWEQKFQQQNAGDLDMTFAAFFVSRNDLFSLFPLFVAFLLFLSIPRRRF